MSDPLLQSGCLVVLAVWRFGRLDGVIFCEKATSCLDIEYKVGGGGRGGARREGERVGERACARACVFVCVCVCVCEREREREGERELCYLKIHGLVPDITSLNGLT